MHGDLSEYNILYHQHEVYFIDVSQSVEHDHPASFDFLREPNLQKQYSYAFVSDWRRGNHVLFDAFIISVDRPVPGKDCENITNFFFKKGVGAVMTLRELFDFITDSAITAENFEEYLEKMMAVCQNRPAPTAKESES